MKLGVVPSELNNDIVSIQESTLSFYPLILLMIEFPRCNMFANDIVLIDVLRLVLVFEL